MRKKPALKPGWAQYSGRSMDVQEELKGIKERNLRVEADKEWETSLARRGILAVATYFAVLVFLYIIRAPNPELAAAVPALAYVLQTLTLPFLKEMWLRNAYKK